MKKIVKLLAVMLTLLLASETASAQVIICGKAIPKGRGVYKCRGCAPYICYAIHYPHPQAKQIGLYASDAKDSDENPQLQALWEVDPNFEKVTPEGDEVLYEYKVTRDLDFE